MLIKPGTRVSLKDCDPADTGTYSSAADVEDLLNHYKEELARLQYLLYAENRRALMIILQGTDTSGKDGTIRHVMSNLSPLGVQVKAFKAPTELELAHDFLWRIHKEVPRNGEIGIFNRSHYEDVLVVRVHDLVPRKTWKGRFRQINHFEHMLVENNVVLLKFFLHISKGEQKRRLEERLKDSTRHWKLSLHDLEERKYWSAYRKAYETVLSRCSTHWAPWHLVPANHKWYRNLVVAKTIVETLSDLNMKYPEPSIDLSKIAIE
jgi:PPK2 family polyphosphate:nucleotide phosphotransferase